MKSASITFGLDTVLPETSSVERGSSNGDIVDSHGRRLIPWDASAADRDTTVRLPHERHSAANDPSDACTDLPLADDIGTWWPDPS